jgi:hypothetical protein
MKQKSDSGWNPLPGLESRTAKIVGTAVRPVDGMASIIRLLVAGDKEARRDVRRESKSSQTLGASKFRVMAPPVGRH